MPRRRQQDLQPVTQLTPAAQPVQQFFGVRIPQPISRIAIDFGGASASLRRLGAQSERSANKEAEQSAQVAQALEAAQGDVDLALDENKRAFDKLADELGLTEASIPAAQEELQRIRGRKRAAEVSGALEGLVKNGQGEQDLEKLYQQVLEDRDIDPSSFDAFELDGYAAILNPSVERIAKSIAAGNAERETLEIHQGGVGRVLKTFEDGVSTTEIQETTELLSTVNGGAILPGNRKMILIDAATQYMGTNPDPDEALDVIAALGNVTFAGTRLADDTSSAVSGGPAISATLNRFENDMVQKADQRALTAGRRAGEAQRSIEDRIETINDAITSAFDVELTPENVRDLLADVEERAQALVPEFEEDVSPDVVSDILRDFRESLNKAQDQFKQNKSVDRIALQDSQTEAAADLLFRLESGQVTADEARNELVINQGRFGGAGAGLFKTIAKHNASLTLRQDPRTKDLATELFDEPSPEGLTADELSGLASRNRERSKKGNAEFRRLLTLPQYTSGNAASRDALLESLGDTEAFKQLRVERDADVAEARKSRNERNNDFNRLLRFSDTAALTAIADPNSDAPPDHQAKANEALRAIDLSSAPQQFSAYPQGLRQAAALSGMTQLSIDSFEEDAALANALNVESTGAASAFTTGVRRRYLEKLKGNTRPPSVLQEEAVAEELASIKENAPEETTRAIKTKNLGGPELVLQLSDNIEESSERNQRITDGLQAGSRALELRFSPDKGEQRPSVKTIKQISGNYHTAVREYYESPPGNSTRRELFLELQAQTTIEQNKILSKKDDGGKLSKEDKLNLFAIGQVTPKFFSMDDIGSTGEIRILTEGNKAKITQLRSDLLTASLSADAARDSITRSLEQSAMFGGKGLKDKRGIRQLFTPTSATRLFKKEKAARVKLEEVLAEAEKLADDDLLFKTDALQAVKDGNFNPLTVPWKSSFAELQRYRFEKKAEFDAFLKAVGITDLNLFMAEQKKVYR